MSRTCWAASLTVLFGATLLVAAVLHQARPLEFVPNDNSNHILLQTQQQQQRRLTEAFSIIPVYSHLPANTDRTISKQLHDLQQTLPSDELSLESFSLTVNQQRSFVATRCSRSAESRFDEFLKQGQPHWATLVFQWCALSQRGDFEMAVYLDLSAPLLGRLYDIVVGAAGSSVLVQADPKLFGPEAYMTGPLVILRQRDQPVADHMLRVLLETPLEVMLANPLHLGQSLNQWFRENKRDDLTILQSSCPTIDANNVLDSSPSATLVYRCPPSSGFCCSIHNQRQTLIVTKMPLWPVPRHPSLDSLARPLGASKDDDFGRDLQYMTTLTAGTVTPQPDDASDKTIFEQLQESCSSEVLDEDCSKCLRDKQGATCKSCASVCKCFCRKFCEKPIPKFETLTYHVTPPAAARDPRRWIPRRIHQTWFDPDIDREKYPNMSRLTQSFRQAGWEYNFYSDADAQAFLDLHFPPAVREAYDALNPGAFKADLFRYCVLLIHGGVYADVDILLESALDSAIPGDVGFMLPLDEPGKPVGHQMCLWNGFIAAAPGHPVLAKAIETVVNQVRNRFTSVDVDATFCPSPELSVLHAFDTLWTAGPCLIGSTLNRVLGRDGLESFKAGEFFPWRDFAQRQKTAEGTESLVASRDNSNPTHRLPGRIILLHQNKWDMGAHRFTFLEQNIVVAATDLPDSNDRTKLENENEETEEAHEHYSKTHAKVGVYGVKHLYADGKRARQNIRLIVNGDNFGKRAAAISSNPEVSMVE